MLSVLLWMCLPSLATDTVATVERELAKVRLIAAIDGLGGGPVFGDATVSNPDSAPEFWAWLHVASTLWNGRSPTSLVIRGNDNGPIQLDLTPLRWMRDLEHIAVIRFNLTQTDLEAIASVQSLKRLTLHECGTRDDDLQILSRLNHLEHLGIAVAPKLDGSGFRHLADLKKLKSIVLEGCGLSDDGVKGLGTVAAVELLYIPDPNIGDEGVRHLSRLQNLKILSLSHSRITDDAAAACDRLPKIELMDLSGTQIGDAGIRQLKHCKQLKTLGLTNTKIGLDSLRFLKSLPSIEDVEIDRTPAAAALETAGWSDIGPTFSFPRDVPAIE